METPPPQFASQPLAPPPVQPTEEPRLQPLAEIPRPKWLVILAGVTMLAFLLGLSRIGHSFGTAINYERAKRHLARGDGAKAAPLLEQLTQEFPRSKDLQIDLADAYTLAKDWEKAIVVLRQFEGVMVKKEEDARLRQIEERFPRLEESK